MQRCKFWTESGQCRFGEGCRFYHDPARRGGRGARGGGGGEPVVRGGKTFDWRLPAHVNMDKWNCSKDKLDRIARRNNAEIWFKRNDRVIRVRPLEGFTGRDVVEEELVLFVNDTLKLAVEDRIVTMDERVEDGQRLEWKEVEAGAQVWSLCKVPRLLTRPPHLDNRFLLGKLNECLFSKWESFVGKRATIQFRIGSMTVKGNPMQVGELRRAIQGRFAYSFVSEVSLVQPLEVLKRMLPTAPLKVSNGFVISLLLGTEKVKVALRDHDALDTTKLSSHSPANGLSIKYVTLDSSGALCSIDSLNFGGFDVRLQVQAADRYPHLDRVERFIQGCKIVKGNLSVPENSDIRFQIIRKKKKYRFQVEECFVELVLVESRFPNGNCGESVELEICSAPLRQSLRSMFRGQHPQQIPAPTDHGAQQLAWRMAHQCWLEIERVPRVGNCSSCLESKSVAAGARCSGEDGHFTCFGCMGDTMNAALAQGKIIPNGGDVPCLSCRGTYELALMLQSLDPQIFKRWVERRAQQAVAAHERDARIQARQEALSREAATRDTKACPRCFFRWGPPVACAHVTCHLEHGGCGMEWCWECQVDYNLIRRGDNSAHLPMCRLHTRNLH